MEEVRVSIERVARRYGRPKKVEERHFGEAD